MPADARAERFVARFQEGWRLGTDEAAWAVWDEILHPDVHMVQPMMAETRGLGAYRREIERLSRVVGGLQAEVHDWAARGDSVFIEFTLAGTIGGERVAWSVVDRLTLGPDGRATERVAYFDPSALLPVLLRHPTLWPEALRRLRS